MDASFRVCPGSVWQCGWFFLFFVMALDPALAEDVEPPQVVHEPCDYYQRGQSMKIIAQFYDESKVFDPKVIFRTKKFSTWRSASFRKVPGNQNFVATIPARLLRGGLDYFIQVYDESGNGPTRYGDKDSPIRLLPKRNAPECVQVPTDIDAPSAAPSQMGLGEEASTQAEAEPPADAPERLELDLPMDSGGSGASETPPFMAQSTPPPAETSACASEDAPLYCSATFWSLLGVGALLAGGGVFLGYCLSEGCFESGFPVDGTFRIDVEGGGPNVVTGGAP